MRLPRVHGVIRRRLLVNFRVDPAVMQRHLPSRFRPKLHGGYAVAGICLIRLEEIRPKRFPRMMGLSSENAAHRVAVTWEEGEGVYIPRRDTGSLLNQLAGGRIFPGEHHRARFDVAETAGRVALRMESADGKVRVEVAGTVAAALPPESIFTTLGEASAFFERGSLGYSATSDAHRLDGVTLHTESWRVEALAIERVHSSFFADASLFPPGSATFDHALIMRNIAHEWETAAEIYV